jgi:hypothetical protein
VGLDNSAFATLVALAGGKTGVWSYCSRLLAAAVPGMPYPTPGASQWWDQYRNYSSYPGYPTQYPGQNRGGQNSQADPTVPSGRRP